MANVTKAYRQDVVAALERRLPPTWTDRVEELEEAIYQFSFVHDCVEAYQFKAQDLCFNVRNLAQVAPHNDADLVALIDLDEFVRMSNEQLVSMCIPAAAADMDKLSAPAESKGVAAAAAPQPPLPNPFLTGLVNDAFEPVQLVMARRKTLKSSWATANRTVDAQVNDEFHQKILKALFGNHNESLIKCRRCVPGTIVNWKMKTKRAVDEGPNIECKCTGCGQEWHYRG